MMVFAIMFGGRLGLAATPGYLIVHHDFVCLDVTKC